MGSKGRTSRREFLGFVSASTAGLAGCSEEMRSCGASGPLRIDDVIRVRIPRIEQLSDRYRWTATASQPGPDDDHVRGNRTRYETSYRDVELRVYHLDGTLLRRAELGNFEAGTTRSRRFETERFPHILTATIGESSGKYARRCYQGVRGADVSGYAGHHPDGHTFDKRIYQLRPRERSYQPTEAEGHVWLPVDHLPPETDKPTPEQINRVPCLQRRMAGNPPDYQAFSLLPRPERWLARDEEYKLRLDESLVERRPPVAEVPERVERLYREVDWNPTTMPVIEELSRQEFARLYATVAGESNPTIPDAPCPYETGPALSCTNHSEGHCRPGEVVAGYRASVAGGEREISVRLIYEWEGLELSTRVE